ncbi:MAG: hypothetical protein A2Y12_07535 [Planctomycetes bacterium GWF2_42_9]|nr:MAG: hypothetical protein A2Y12_07535 [Planctomycetes bacterium GWF2_42_9]
MFKTKRPLLVVFFLAALLLYTAFAVLLFYPHHQSLVSYKRLFPLEAIIASAGVFILCRRWVLSFFASLIGGAVYGFGTYATSFLCFHPLAGVVYALIPWTFIPAVFFYRLTNLDKLNKKIISALLVFLSIIFIFAAFQFFVKNYFYPIPVQTNLQLRALLGIIAPTGVKQDIFAPGFYHVCIAGLIMGLGVLIETRRIGVIFLFLITSLAAFYKPILNVPPVIWESIPVLICSVIIATGLETIVLAGAGDGRWLLTTVAILLTLSIINIFITDHHTIIPLSAGLFGMGIASVLSIYFIAESNRSWHLARKFILYAPAMIDVIVSTKQNIDMIF